MMKKIFVLSLIAVCSLFAMAQTNNDSYKATVIDYLRLDEGAFFTNASPYLSQITPYALCNISDVVAADVDTKTLESQYMSQQIVDDCAKIYTQFFLSRNITEKELKSYIAICKNPKFILANAHRHEADELLYEIIRPKLLEPASQKAAGGHIFDITPMASRSYAKLFHKYYVMYNMDNLLNRINDALKSNMRNNMPEEELSVFFAYINRNFEPLLVDFYNGFVTAEDLNVLIKTKQQATYAKIEEEVANFLDDSSEFGVQMLALYTTWLEDQYNAGNEAFTALADKNGDMVVGSYDVRGSDEDDVFEVIEQMPSFPGGINAMMQYLGSNVKYPVAAQENGLQGRVVVGFVVDKDGSIIDAHVLETTKTMLMRAKDPKTGKQNNVELPYEGGDISLEREALRVVQAMPKWIPGKQDGHAVKVKFNVPITFKLQ